MNVSLLFLQYSSTSEPLEQNRTSYGANQTHPVKCTQNAKNDLLGGVKHQGFWPLSPQRIPYDFLYVIEDMFRERKQQK